MPHTYALGQARASSAGNPITFSYAVAKGDTVIGLLLKTAGATDRAGGAPTWGSLTFTQASTTQKAAASPECGCEVWYLLNAAPGTQTLTIPNTGAVTLFYTVVIGRARAGWRSVFDNAVGANNTSANPSAGALVVRGDNIIFAIVASGAQTWNPSAQVGTIIANTDDGAHGGGEQYILQGGPGTVGVTWTFATSDDWGAVAAAFMEDPPPMFENYHAIDVGDGMSATERIR